MTRPRARTRAAPRSRDELDCTTRSDAIKVFAAGSRSHLHSPGTTAGCRDHPRLGRSAGCCARSDNPAVGELSPRSVPGGDGNPRTANTCRSVVQQAVVGGIDRRAVRNWSAHQSMGQTAMLRLIRTSADPGRTDPSDYGGFANPLFSPHRSCGLTFRDMLGSVAHVVPCAADRVVGRQERRMSTPRCESRQAGRA